MRRAVSAAFLQNKEIVIVRKGETWILPGGKPLPNEPDRKCLKRELGEELPNLTYGNFFYYGKFIGTTPHQGDVLEADVYLSELKDQANIRTSNNPDENVKEARIVGYGQLRDFQFSDITLKILESLRRDSYI